jgi:O-antigen ligase
MLANNTAINKYISYLFFLIPISLVSGPFFSDAIISIISIFFLYVLFKEKKISYLRDKKVVVFFIFCIFLILRALLSVNVVESIVPSLFYFRFGLFVLATVYLIKKIPNFEKNFTKFLLYTIIFVSFDAYVQIIFGYNLFGMKIAIADRISGLFGDEYVLGSYLVRLFPLLLALIIDKINFNFMNILIFIISISLFNLLIFYTGERAAFVLNVILMILLTAIVKKIRKILIVTFLSSLVLIGISVKFNKNLYDRMVQQTYSEVFKEKKIRLFTEGHQNHIKSAFKMFNDNKLFGHGVKNYRVICKDPKYFEKITSCSTHPHNSYAQLLAETGLFGFSLILFIFLYISKDLVIQFLSSFRNKEIDNKKTIISILIFINLFPFSPSGSFFNNWLSIIYFLPIGFYLNRLKK